MAGNIVLLRRRNKSFHGNRGHDDRDVASQRKSAIPQNSVIGNSDPDRPPLDLDPSLAASCRKPDFQGVCVRSGTRSQQINRSDYPYSRFSNINEAVNRQTKEFLRGAILRNLSELAMIQYEQSIP